MQLWSSDDKVIAVGINIMIFAAIFQVFDAATLIYSGALRGAGDTLWLAGVSAFAAIGVLGIGGAIITVLFPQLGSVGPWIAATLSIVTTGLANRYRFKSNRWMRIDLFKRRPVGVPVEIEPVAE